MKKLLFFIVALLFLASCDDDGNKDQLKIESTYENVRVEIIE